MTTLTQFSGTPKNSVENAIFRPESVNCTYCLDLAKHLAAGIIHTRASDLLTFDNDDSDESDH